MLVSYLSQKNGFEATAYIGYDINTRNTETDYLSGQQFHIDVTVGAASAARQRPDRDRREWIYVKQTTGDSGSGARLGSFEEMSTGVGPVLLYAAQFGKVGFAAEAKWLPQIGTQNTLKGDFVWFKIGAQF